MDQNTNNSFTSAPQGGDFSDIIIPNAYVAKPKNKNLKKYLVFGVVGVVALILISLIVKAIFVDSRTMSKQEFIQFAESEDMNSIEWFENFLITVKNGGMSFDLIFTEQYYNEISSTKNTLANLKTVISKKNNISGNAGTKKLYAGFIENFNQRYETYNNALEIYEDFYQAYKTLNTSLLAKYISNSSNPSYSSAAKALNEVILQAQRYKDLKQKEDCLDYYDDGTSNSHCASEWRVLRDSKILFDSQDGLKKIFLNANQDVDYEKNKTLSDYVNTILVQAKILK